MVTVYEGGGCMMDFLSFSRISKLRGKAKHNPVNSSSFAGRVHFG